MDVPDRVLLADTVNAILCEQCQAPLPGGAAACPQCGHAVAVVTGLPEIVRRLRLALGAQFEVVRLVGRGGFAEVYEVQDTELRRRLAVKVLRTDIEWSPDMATRFKQEARAIAQLSHPHTVPIHFVGEGEGLVFYVMPFIEGLTLADILRADGPLDPKLAAGVAIPILDALDHAHRLGIVHRDIKPDNILVDGASGRPLLVDFGISTMRGIESRSEDLVLGTPHYMSPEQALGERDVDARADLYAMGAVLLQMVTGHPPFEGATSGEILAKHIADPLDLPEDDALLPEWLRQVIERALQKRREDRFESAGAMVTALREGLPDATRSLMTGTHAIPRISREDPTVQLHIGARARRLWPRRRSTRVLVATTLVVSLAAIGFSAWTAFVGAPPRFLVRNSLLAPVAVSVNGSGERPLQPGDSMQVPLRRGDPLEARWHVIGPRSSSGDLLGESLGGRIADSAPRGMLRSDIAAGAVAAGYLAPRVTNTTADTIHIMLRDSADALVPCECNVPPGGSLLLGYFRDDRLKAVEARNRQGVVLTWNALLQRKNSATGEVAISVRPADFTPPRSIGPRTTPISPSSQLVAPLPTIRFQEPELITDSARPATDSAAKAKPTPKQRDPLGSIFHNR
jgi:serine/threonine protein kinase